jgi:hypothetical protein
MITTDFSQEELKYIKGGIVGGQYFQTLIQTNGTTFKEKRFNTFHIPLFRGQLTNMSLSEDQMTYFHDFYIRRKGSQQGFRWKNPIDFKVTPYKEGVLDIDPDTWTIGGVMEPSGQLTLEATAAKIYVSKGYVTKKPLYLPRGTTVKIYEAGSFVDERPISIGGKFQYLGDPIALSISLEFDTPTWFTQNELPLVVQGTTAEDEGIFRLNTVSIEERLLDFAGRSQLTPN